MIDINFLLERTDSNFSKLEKETIIKNSLFLHNYVNIPQRVYHILNNIIEIPKCKFCNTELQYKPSRGKGNGYGNGYCNHKCYLNNKTKESKENTKSRNDIKLQDTDSYIKCEICGEAVKAIATHIALQPVKHNNVRLLEYQKLFPKSPTIAKNTSKLLSEQFSGENNPMHSSKTTKEFRKSNSPFSKDFYIKKGMSEQEAEDYIKVFAKDAIKDRVGATTLEYFITKFNGNIELAKEALKERQSTFTLEKCIDKYGEEKGTLRFKDRQQKSQKTLYEIFIKEGDGRNSGSSIANELKNILIERTNIIQPKYEKFINDNSKKYGNGFSYDFVYLEKKRLIEFNGDFWHCNPELFEPDYFHKVKNKTAKEMWEYDFHKKFVAESYNYEVYTVWENDYNRDKEGTIQKCLDFLLK